MANSEMRAMGIAAKFCNSFAKNGGSLDMLNWVADDPGKMERIVGIADEWLLRRETGVYYKLRGCETYNPREFFSLGDHDGIKFVQITGNVSFFASDKSREIQETALQPYSLRKSTQRSDVYREGSRLELDMQVSVDHVRNALRLPAEKAVLAVDGSANEFYLPHVTESSALYLPIQLMYVTEMNGWALNVPAIMGPTDEMKGGTRLIVDGNKNH